MICIKCEQGIEHGVINGDQLIDMISSHADDLKHQSVLPTCPVCGCTLSDQHTHTNTNVSNLDLII